MNQAQQDRAALMEKFNHMHLDEQKVAIATYAGILQQMIHIHNLKIEQDVQNEPLKLNQINQAGEE